MNDFPEAYSPRFRMKWLTCVLVQLALVGMIHAAEITARPINKGGGYLGIFAIEGEIERGDYAKFERLVRSYGHAYNSVTIASKGGNLLEAMKIGRLIRSLKFDTNAPYKIDPDAEQIISFGVKDGANDVCASACFFIYVAGVHRGGNLIGIHRPFLDPGDYKKMKVDDAIDLNQKLKVIVTQYFEEMSVPATYADRLFAIPKEQIEWLKQDEIDKIFSGYVPEIAEWIKAKCPSLTDADMTLREGFRRKGYDNLAASDKQTVEALLNKESAVNDCQYQLHKDISCRAWAGYFSFLDSNPCNWKD